MVWQTYSKDCQMVDKLSEYGVKLEGSPLAANASQPRKLRILMFGDSVDRCLLQDACSIGKVTQGPCWPLPGCAYTPAPLSRHSLQCIKN